MLEKQMTVPTARPATTPRTVKLRPGTTLDLDAILPVLEAACYQCEGILKKEV